MKITEVSVGYSRLVTGENYSNRRYSCELTAQVDSEKPEDVRDLLMKRCQDFVESKISASKVIVISESQAKLLEEVMTKKQKKLIGSISCTLINDELPF